MLQEFETLREILQNILILHVTLHLENKRIVGEDLEQFDFKPCLGPSPIFFFVFPSQGLPGAPRSSQGLPRGVGGLEWPLSFWSSFMSDF